MGPNSTDTSDAENAALTSWVTTSHEHVRAYERALLGEDVKSEARSMLRCNIEVAIGGH